MRGAARHLVVPKEALFRTRAPQRCPAVKALSRCSIGLLYRVAPPAVIVAITAEKSRSPPPAWAAWSSQSRVAVATGRCWPARLAIPSTRRRSLSAKLSLKLGGYWPDSTLGRLACTVLAIGD